MTKGVTPVRFKTRSSILHCWRCKTSAYGFSNWSERDKQRDRIDSVCLPWELGLGREGSVVGICISNLATLGPAGSRVLPRDRVKGIYIHFEPNNPIPDPGSDLKHDTHICIHIHVYMLILCASHLSAHRSTDWNVCQTFPLLSKITFHN